MPITYPQTANYKPHQLAMLAGVNKRDQIQNEKSTLKSRFGSVVDLEEKKEVEKHRVNMTNQLRELVRLDLTTIRKFFRDSDPYKTGYVSQRQFREALSLLNIPIEAAIYSQSGAWHEERELHAVDGTEGMRPGPFKEHLMWLQDPLGAQNYPDVSHGHVKYEDWLKNLMTPDNEIAKEKAIADTTHDASELYELWRLVVAKKHDLLKDFWDFDKEKLGYVKTDDFHRALQIALGINKDQASLILSAIPFEGKCGSIAYRRWLAEFCRSPRVDWQSYLNMNLLANGSRELDMKHAEKAATTKAKMEAQVQQHVLQHERMLKDNHAHWQQLQVPHLGHGQPMPYGTHMPHGPRMPYGGY